ncbi:MAG: hypothetical protein QME48_01465 [bacterium]|uniref:Uncharacterized protein n=2 Tax=Bacteria candidate phyla TaxID=1783234 RepID=A0A124G092_UNCT6|nr:MAG: hypothetical protein XD76_1598 [candidate division TA06 bacterium 32_111]KUK86637.1 MAG: hypothetical protein XE03_1336 [candidate division TA06 bacterium 34_109]MDI6699887.1 hypothetical protein [bacterium]HAF07402.1 hypothetical protein [candidate division WOR-3 bacterium]HCP17188.1 hypothetical protein [candidate division WOR-3 bacterium]
MKKLLFSPFFFLSLFLFSFDLNFNYNYGYFYFYKINYFSSHDLVVDVENSNDFLKFFAQFDARIYQGDARYEIPYPDIDFSMIGVMPKYIYLSNQYRFTQLYLSLFKEGVNLKIGKFPVKWGISEIYSPLDIFYFSSPFDLITLKEFPSNFLFSFSKKDFTLSLVYQDNQDFFSSKEGVSFEYLNQFFNSRIFISRYSQVRKNLLSTDSVENFIFGFSSLTEYFGPALWNEFVVIKSNDLYKFYLQPGWDYTFFEKLYINQEFYINFKGLKKPYSDINIINKYLNKDFLMGRYYMFLTSVFNVKEKINISLNSILNLDDRSFIGVLNLSYNPLSNLISSISLVQTFGETKDEFYKMPTVFLFQIGTKF